MVRRLLRIVCLTIVLPVSESWSSNHPQHEQQQFKNRSIQSAKEERIKENTLVKSFRAAAVASTILATSLSVGSFPVHADDETASSTAAGKRYWSIMQTSPAIERVAANEALLDYAVGTINTQYYDNTGGARFNAQEFYRQWKTMKKVAEHEVPVGNTRIPADISLESRDGSVHGLKWLVNSLDDPFSKYLTREELKQELERDQQGFLGTGALVEPPPDRTLYKPRSSSGNDSKKMASSLLPAPTTNLKQTQPSKKFLSVTRVANLPLVTAVAPDSPAERAGLVVGDRIVAVGDVDFLGWTRRDVAKALQTKYNADSYVGWAKLTVAKPVYAGRTNTEPALLATSQDDTTSQQTQTELVVGYRQTRVLVPSTKASETLTTTRSAVGNPSAVFGGDAIVHYELLRSSSGSIFDHLHSGDTQDDYKVGYIRLTRFSKKSTEGYLKAVQDLEEAGAQSYILDLRNNYGGIIQEAMLTASTLLRDPHAVLCYTMNARGGFTPHDVEEYAVDKRYPGYLLSKESQRATLDQVRRESPGMFEDSGVAWDPPSSFASLHEQVTKRGIRRVSYDSGDPSLRRQQAAQKKIVLLINEGTASSAEVFTAALHDNARVVALVGTKTYGKGLIQHTFPMPDGGGLRITVAEYLTPSLQHVTHVGNARFDRETGSFVGGGIRPDISCESKGIPGNIRADLCVGEALDALEEASAMDESSSNDGSFLIGPVTGFPSSLLGSRHR